MKVLRQHKWISAVIALVLVAAAVGWSFFQSKYSLTCTFYEVCADKIKSPIRILQLTDLHNSEFGHDNEKLVNMVKEQTPDLIVITGDLLDSSDDDTETAVSLIRTLNDIAPVYVSMGNHEKEYEEQYGVNITSLYEAAGAVVLERQYEDIELNGQTVRLGGIYGYCLPDKYLATYEADPDECAFLNEFQNTDLYTILLCHMPVCWIVNDGIDEWDIDCVFAGHAHGGQIRLPLIGGLWAPDQGWFPGEEAGLYYSEHQDKVMVLSRGLGSTEAIPRFNNIPEIVVVDIIP